MSRTGPPRAVLDTDIIFSRVLHDLMGRIAKHLRLLDLLWSEELLAEARRSLIEGKGLTEEVAARWVDYLPQSFPTGCIDISAVPDGLDLASLTRDPGDVHVCALAIAGGADYLFTFDRGYLEEPLRRHGVEVPGLDRFLVELCKEQPEAFRRSSKGRLTIGEAAVPWESWWTRSSGQTFPGLPQR